MNFSREQLSSLGCTFVGDKALDVRGRVIAILSGETFGLLPSEYGYKPLFRFKPAPPENIIIKDGENLSSLKKRLAT